MTTLTLQLEGPLQSWGSSSRFTVRETESRPTKSGVIGLLAAAQGRSRETDITDLAGLRFGVRVDSPGTVLRDFQTETDWQSSKSKPLTNRYYLQDAKFTAVFEGQRSLLEDLAHALESPTFPLFLGRRSCPVSRPIKGIIAEGTLEDGLQNAEWLIRKNDPRATQGALLPFTRDILPGETAENLVRDTPLSFSSAKRAYDLRPVVHGFVRIDGNVPETESQRHNPMQLLGGI
ncbi:type I-E CRISPR-associated protein Cas5/CasD [Corynebacterium suicordis]|uniref:type I-E CRISPR-associated protein Cas5/CasD n=1 Tax=uncultured Corynebacterium sp. TaxID=159447 RepID=UPI00259AB034|nr:type I-E CRISPR-associated protein Cas5/CasD [uncultured Corynebacterium sp.]